MDVFLSDEALDVEALMSDREHERLWDVLELIAADPAAAKSDPRNRYVSSQQMWGTHIPATKYTAFWWVDDLLRVILIADETAGGF